MSDKMIVDIMIDFIETIEREAQVNKIMTPTNKKKDVVKMIVDKLEREMKNEDN